MEFKIDKCMHCQQEHVVELQPYVKKDDPLFAWTHWYLCPATGEPASVRLDAEQKVEIDERILRSIVEAQQAGQLFLAVWHVRAGQLFRPFWLTDNFPKGDFMPAIEMLKKEVEREASDTLPAASLTSALPPQRAAMQVAPQQPPVDEEKQPTTAPEMIRVDDKENQTPAPTRVVDQYPEPTPAPVVQEAQPVPQAAEPIDVMPPVVDFQLDSDVPPPPPEKDERDE